MVTPSCFHSEHEKNKQKDESVAKRTITYCGAQQPTKNRD